MNLSYIPEETRALILIYGFELYTFTKRNFTSPNINRLANKTYKNLQITLNKTLNQYIWILDIQFIIMEYCFDIYNEVLSLKDTIPHHYKIRKQIIHDDGLVSDVINSLIGNDEFVYANLRCNISIEFPKFWKITITNSSIQLESIIHIIAVNNNILIDSIHRTDQYTVIMINNRDFCIKNQSIDYLSDSTLYSYKWQYKQYKILLSFVHHLALESESINL